MDSRRGDNASERSNQALKDLTADGKGAEAPWRIPD
jgi:hypothetical protein